MANNLTSAASGVAYHIPGRQDGSTDQREIVLIQATAQIASAFMAHVEKPFQYTESGLVDQMVGVIRAIKRTLAEPAP